MLSSKVQHAVHLLCRVCNAEILHPLLVDLDRSTPVGDSSEVINTYFNTFCESFCDFYRDTMDETIVGLQVASYDLESEDNEDQETINVMLLMCSDDEFDDERPTEKYLILNSSSRDAIDEWGVKKLLEKGYVLVQIEPPSNPNTSLLKYNEVRFYRIAGSKLPHIAYN